MTAGVTFLLGGARSGKSALAVEIGRRHHGPVVFVATAEAIDDDMHDRIIRHRAERPVWPTIEEPIDLARALTDAGPDGLVIVDCLTVWVGNLFARVTSPPQRAQSYRDMSEVLAGRRGPTVVISNEVGLGLHPGTELGREYRDELGRLNQRVAALAERSLFLVAGRAIALTDPWEMLA